MRKLQEHSLYVESEIVCDNDNIKILEGEVE